jgi:hypothetical protein
MPQANAEHITRHFPRALSEGARMKVEAAIEAHLAAIEALTDCLDTSEPDSDLEPYLAGLGRESDDREADEEREPEEDLEAEPDAEPPAHPEHCGGTYGSQVRT